MLRCDFPSDRVSSISEPLEPLRGEFEWELFEWR